MVMSWILLVLAGLLEIGWAVGLKFTDGFRRLGPSLLLGAAIVGSLLLLAMAVRNLPIGTAYAVWVGIGAFGAAICGILFFNETLTPARSIFLLLLVVAIIGLKATSPSATD